LGIERWDKINSVNSVSESWTGIGSVTLFFATADMIEWPRLKIVKLVYRGRDLQTLQVVKLIEKLATSWFCRGRLTNPDRLFGVETENHGSRMHGTNDKLNHHHVGQK
jgi:hypothetical protein